MKTFPRIGIEIPQVLLPTPEIDLHKWAVIAVDQFTSQPEYWQQVQSIVGHSPSTLHLVLPEIYIGGGDEPERIAATQRAMKQYVDEGLLQPFEGFVLVERTVNGKTRRGLMLALDLERYDYNKGSQSLVRATEGTILDRLPPRIKIRRGSPLEVPHILVLIDDPQCTVIEPLYEQRQDLPVLYDFELMLGSGRLRGYGISAPALQQQVVSALENLGDPQAFRRKYQVGEDQQVLLFAMGDGNHSLATAKAVWEELKPIVGMDHPARYALVEIENVHDDGLHFAPIHRVVFGLKEDWRQAVGRYYGERAQIEPVEGLEDMIHTVNMQAGDGQLIGVISPEGYAVLRVSLPESSIPTGTLQSFLDEWLKQGGAGKIDYVHGEDVIDQLGRQPGHVSFYLPGMQKSDLFKTVVLDGAFPRKTFSMGEAKEKRFYMETRKIV